MIQLKINNETASLAMVIVGIANDFGGAPALSKCIDPKSRVHILAGTYPIGDDIVMEMDALIAVFENYKINTNQLKTIC